MPRHLLDVYGVELYLVTNERQWANLRRRLSFLDGAPESAGLAQFAVWEPAGAGRCQAHMVFWLDVGQHDTLAELVDTVAHEATHGAGAVFDWIGSPVVGGANEPHAYLVGWLTRWLWDNVDKATLAA